MSIIEKALDKSEKKGTPRRKPASVEEQPKRGQPGAAKPRASARPAAGGPPPVESRPARPAKGSTPPAPEVIATWVGVVEIELDGDLASRIEWLEGRSIGSSAG